MNNDGYNWLFHRDYTFYKWGDLLVVITGISGHNCGLLARTLTCEEGASAATLAAFAQFRAPLGEQAKVTFRL